MIILGIGSNVGDRLGFLAKAVAIINKTVMAVTETSPIYESPALLKEGAPENWNKPFLNMAIAGETHLSPEDLLKEVKKIEKALGRKEVGTWAPREVDIDILAYGTLSVEGDGLTIPHVGLCTRPFALLPLADVAPNWQYPVEGAFKGKTAFEISSQLFSDTSGAVKTELKLEKSDSELVA